MKGRKPPFRLVACAVGFDGRPANIQPAVSDGFVVSSATTRIPRLSDLLIKAVMVTQPTELWIF